MKKITEAIKRLSQDQIDELASIVKIKKSVNNYNETIISRILSFRGMNSILFDLKLDELNVLSLVYQNKKGITFSEIEKNLKIDTIKIEEISKLLAQRLLVYVLKNREKLHNKLDKLHNISEVSDFLTPLNANSIISYIKTIFNYLESKDLDSNNSPLSNSPILEVIDTVKYKGYANNLIELIFKSGGVLLLEEAYKLIPSQVIEGLLLELKKKKIIHICQDLNISSKSFILLSEGLFILLLNQLHSEKVIQGKSCHNHYHFLLNIINTYDTVSSHGLSLTKENRFRKIDSNRLTKSMFKIYNIEREEINPKYTAQLSLYVLNFLKGVKIKKGSIIITLTNIERELNNPIEFLIKVFNLLPQKVDNRLFAPPFIIYNSAILFHLMELISLFNESSISYLRSAYLIKQLSEINSEKIIDLIKIRENILSQFKLGIHFLCITGIIEINDGIIRLSDIGLEIERRRSDEKTEKSIGVCNDEDNGRIYINPDFSLIIPKNEIPSEAQYHILAYSDVIKDDIILHARISKDSIIRAYKRGMSQSKLISTLRKFSNNSLPQNLTYLLNEWQEQTVQLNILNATILNVSHPSFLDELSHSDLQMCIIERISPTYAIIDRRYINRIIKFTKKSNVSIKLFEDIDGFD
ncbi:MAG: helicase-associated domain-containing protein [Spirochaetota bacterium]|nr:helicase-associated domain-containing protein [Spirochaetota bacterium]